MTSKSAFSRLLEPGTLGKVKTRNRMIRSGAGIIFLDDDYFVKEESVRFYEAIARGGIGLIILGGTIVEHPLGTCHPGQMLFSDDKYMPGYKEIVDVVHKHNCPIFAQIHHGGVLRGMFNMMMNESIQPVSSSDLSRAELQPLESDFGMPVRGLTTSEVKEMVGKFADAGVRAQKAAFDGLEINVASHHLGNSFLSRVWNRRHDEYGIDSLENRARFVVEIIQECKKRLGQDYPVGVLMNGAEFGADKATTPEEAQGLAVIFEKAGADWIHVRGFGYGEYWDLHLPETIFYPDPPKPLAKPLDGSHGGPGVVLPLAANIKNAVKVPVITVGRLDPILGEKALEEGKADFIAMQRRIIADPDLPNKVIQGRLEDIRPCTACLGCFVNVEHNRPIRCRINAALGGTQDYIIDKAQKKKKVVVVGGGPAGMEAARVAALRGHDVTLYEKERSLGGLMRVAWLMKNTDIEDLQLIIDWFSMQLKKLGVKVVPGKKADADLILKHNPDTVIIAVGGKAVLPEIPGVDSRNVMGMPTLHNMMKMFMKFLKPGVIKFLSKIWMPIGKQVVIIGGGVQGLELAEFLTRARRRITIVDKAQTLFDDRWFLVQNVRAVNWLAKHGATMITEARDYAITNRGVIITDKDGKKQTIEADSVIPVAPLIPNRELAERLQGKVPEVYSVGDCFEYGLVIDAVGSGYRSVRNL